jgi:hypothetical protein
MAEAPTLRFLPGFDEETASLKVHKPQKLRLVSRFATQLVKPEGQT